MSLLGIMIIFRNQMERELGKYASEKEGILNYPACIQLPTHSIYSITTRYSRSMTARVINICNVMQNSDVNLFWKIQYPTKNHDDDMGQSTFTFQWYSLIKKQRCDVDDCTFGYMQNELSRQIIRPFARHLSTGIPICYPRRTEVCGYCCSLAYVLAQGEPRPQS
jgi:hypothetical protein